MLAEIATKVNSQESNLAQRNCVCVTVFEMAWRLIKPVAQANQKLTDSEETAFDTADQSRRGEFVQNETNKQESSLSLSRCF